MALATYTDLETRLGIVGELSDADQDRADALLALASELVMSQSGGREEIDAPIEALLLTVEIVVRVWVNPSSAQSESMGSASVSFGDGSGLFLTENECKSVRKAFRGGSSLNSMQLK